MGQTIAKPDVDSAEQEAPLIAVVSARELSRRYGEGETAVDALREVDLEIRREEGDCDE